ncbi:hypothetical protein Tsubulata_030364 [Turnera subulata]|uniref:Pectinesterase n=1 Tax=Turnera subulata TaxID=218843 RepID=A0A9Q0GIH3_9ROSI|nr:hypothetical protein Tsubulata_030364 [Turnera subulata]
MQAFRSSLFLLIIALAFCCFVCSKAQDCQLFGSLPNKVAYTITVDKPGRGNFTTIQKAIDSLPVKSNKWIRIQLAPGKYREKINLPVNKPCVFLDGGDKSLTSIEWDDHVDTSSSSTFSSFADNVVLKGITFKNTYNLEASTPRNTWKQAVAARIRGDKTLIYQCAFYGVQDTFWSDKGRHYIVDSYIEGSLDFIFGGGQSVYKDCTVSINVGELAPGTEAFITAQKREWATDTGGFVFKNSNFTGKGKAWLGRAWGAFATVIIVDSHMDDIIVPAGWHAWNSAANAKDTTYAESNNKGPGADTSKRVTWEKNLTAAQLSKFTDMSFINSDKWLASVPISSISV